MIDETKSLIEERFRVGYLSMNDLYELRTFIIDLEHQWRKQKIKKLQHQRSVNK